MRVHCRIHIVLLIGVLLVLVTPGISLAAPVGTFTKVEGSVDIHRLSDIAASPIRVGDSVSQGDAIRTKRNGKAEIRFLDETVIQLAPETRITIDEYSYRGGNARERGLIGLFRGKIRSIVAKVKSAVVPVSSHDSSFNIKTPTAIAGVKGTDFIVYYERGVSGIVFIEGQGFVYNPVRPERIVNVRGGQATFVTGGGSGPLAPRPATESVTASFTKDLPGSEAAPSEEDHTPGEQPASDAPQVTSVDVVEDTPIGDITGPPSGSQGGNTTVPITEAHPSLIPTPVHLTITIP